MTLVTVEVKDLAAASCEMARTVADPLFASVGDALAPLFSVAGMAGDDPPAERWAAGYDRAAPEAIAAAEDVINACYRASAMLAASTRNYASAETASTTRGHPVDRTLTAAVATLPDDTRVGLPSTVPSASAGVGGSDLPSSWHFIAHHLGGYIWPNGHQDRLHRAAAAWHASARALDDHAFDATIVDLGPLVDRLPEGPDIATVCMGLGDHLRAVARAHRALGHACSQLAEHLDHAHSQVEHELVALAAWTAGIQTIGAVASVFSFGTAEAPTQAVQAARIASAVARVTSILRSFAVAVRAATATIGPIADAAADVRAAVSWLRDLRIVEVEVTAVPGLRVYQVARVEGAISEPLATTEEGAVGRLTRVSTVDDHAAGLKRMRQIESKYKHAGDFGVTVPRGKAGFAAFEKSLADFVADPATRTIAGTYRRSPVILHFSVDTQLVVIDDVSGNFITGFRMSLEQLQRVQRDGAIGLE